MDALQAKAQLQQVIARHPEGVGQLLRNFGVELAPDPAVLALTALLKGRPFTDQVDALMQNRYLSYGEPIDADTLPGIFGTPTVPAAGGGKSVWETIGNIGAAAGGVGAILGLFGGGGNNPMPAQPQPMPNQQLPPAEETIMGLPKPIFYGAAAVVALLVILLAVKK